MSNLIDDLLQRGEQALKDLLGRSENFNLEFKIKEKDQSPILSNADKKNLGTELSGFSNADGGLVIFGVKTKKKGHVDVASELRPITEIDRFKSEVDGRLDELIRPANPAINVHIIRCEDDLDRGYLLVEIGKSDNRPHMSMAPDHAKYFRRSFDRTLVMDHTLIRDLIMAPKEAVLVPDIRVEGQGTIHRQGKAATQAQLVIHLRNMGHAMASMPYARIWTNPLLGPRNVNNLAPSSPRPDKSFAFYGSRDAVIHPSDQILFGAFSIAFVIDQDGLNQALEQEHDLAERPDLWIFGKVIDQGTAVAGPFEDLEMRINVGAENATVHEERILLSKADLITLALPAAIRGLHEIRNREQAMEKALAAIESAFGPSSISRPDG